MQDTRSSQLLFAAAQELGLQPAWLTEYGLLTVTIEGREQTLFASKSLLNSALSSYLAANKHATRVLLERVGLPTIPYCLPESRAVVAAFIAQYGRVVAKPTLGRRSEGVLLLDAQTNLNEFKYETMLLEKYIKGDEWRYLVLNNEVIAVHKKEHVERISQPTTQVRHAIDPAAWMPELVAVSLRAARVLGLHFCAVDFIIDTHNIAWILEVNSEPALHRFHHPDTGAPVPVALLLLEATVADLRRKT